ncbi:MAG: hypothetical protein OEX11_07665 [Nitrosomonas sp.]|nr:hypothetical protein [Nitrosomonas sp.]
MIDIGSRLNAINTLIADGTDKSLRYAALESRLTIELICYERLLVSYDYISYGDLRKWQPKDVIQQVIEDANENAASTFTLSISSASIEKTSSPQSKEDYEKFEYVPVGTQIGFDFRVLGKLWNALSNLALHIQLPKSRMDEMPLYADSKILKEKICETVKELEKLGEGNMSASSFGPEYSFECVSCQTVIKKKMNQLRNDQVVSCLSQSCLESYRIHVEDNEIFHSRRILNVTCDKCNFLNLVPAEKLEKLRIGQTFDVFCASCTGTLVVEPVLCKRN